MTEDAWIGLGANLGDRHATLESAIDALRGLPHTRLIARSRTYRSPAWQANGPDDLNAVACLSTSLTPHDLLHALQNIETRFGRLRPYPGAPRTLDLDLLLMRDRVLHTPELTLPHPRLHERAFVLRPLAELAPDLPIPGRGTVAACLPPVALQDCTVWCRP
jgi:2-amino-4-hydroxy-6-hydroxymethyldihydropteridine diphosphokinase